MYRIPADLNLSNIVGSEIDLIGLGKYQIQFCFRSGETISVESKIEIWSKQRIVCIWNRKTHQWSNQLFQELLGVEVSGFRVENDTTLSINFGNDCTLKLYDDSDEYESIVIQPETIVI